MIVCDDDDGSDKKDPFVMKVKKKKGLSKSKMSKTKDVRNI
jgi:hypothetical protein